MIEYKVERQAGERIVPPEAVLGFCDLPGTRLHYATSGSGSPLVIMPATVSLIRQWLPLVQFMGLRFKSHFFELPGHGSSSPYPQKFNSLLVPKTVEDFVNHLGYDRFTLMGFSFGGLLALRTLEYLQDRIDKVILMSPVVSYRALVYSRRKQWILKRFMRILKNQHAQKTAAQIMHAETLHRPLIFALSRISNIDKEILNSKDALRIPVTTLDVFSYTVDEILDIEFQPSAPFSIPCYFGMSVYDDLIQYPVTVQLVQQQFRNIKIQQFYHPYHQPPQQPTFEWFVQEFYPFLDVIG